MEITVDQLRALGDGGATILNVGAHAGKNEIRGAIRYRPSDLMTSDHLSLPIALDRPVVLYDEHGNGHDTGRIAEKFAAEGFDVRTLAGGYEAWEAADGETQEASTEQVVPPSRPSQVQELDRRL